MGGKNMKIRSNYFTFSFVTIMALCISACSNNVPTPSKPDLIAAYNDFAKISPPTLGEGDYPLTANFSKEDKGKEAAANALVEIGLIHEQSDSRPGRVVSSDKDKVKTYVLTERGKQFYNPKAHGFVWGYHSATDIVDTTGPVKTNGTNFLYVSFKTTIIDIPDWAKKRVITDNYPVVKTALQKNEFTFKATFKLVGKLWTLVEVQ